jgi:hypothetical protein
MTTPTKQPEPTDEEEPQVAEDKDFTRELYEGDTQERSWDANVKRTYDEFQQESLETIRHQRTLFDKFVTDAQQYDNQRQVIANQALQNAVETANMTGKQAVRHSDLAIDRQWNLDEQGLAAVIVNAAISKHQKEDHASK